MPDGSNVENTLDASGRVRSRTVGDVPDAIRRRYFTDEQNGPGLGFYINATVNRAAFRDRGARLSIDRTDPNAIRDMVEIARHRGWNVLSVRGSAEFRREAWLAARQLGLDVRGYQASERDLQELERRRERRGQADHRREHQLDRSDERRARSRDLRQDNRTQRQDERGAAQLRVVDAVVRSRVQDPESQQRIMDGARSRIASWLERGASFEVIRPGRSTQQERARTR